MVDVNEPPVAAESYSANLRVAWHGRNAREEDDRGGAGTARAGLTISRSRGPLMGPRAGLPYCVRRRGRDAGRIVGSAALQAKIDAPCPVLYCACFVPRPW